LQQLEDPKECEEEAAVPLHLAHIISWYRPVLHVPLFSHDTYFARKIK
jgi:hypothetical protein